MINAKQESTSRYPSGLSSNEVTTKIEIDSEFPDRKVKVGTTLDPEIKDQLITFLRENKNTFAWSAKDMPGIDKIIITHELNVDPSFKPIKQKKKKTES